MKINFDDSTPVELGEDIELEFVKKNMLFAFDDIEMERTVEFSIPATPHNNAIFGLSNDEHYSGEKMRRRFPVQLQASGVAKEGYLYLTSYAQGEYKAVFVTGQLLGLKDISEAGKLADIYPTDDKIDYPTDDIKNAGDEQTPIGVYNYVKKQGGLYPSISLNHVLSSCLSRLGYNIDYPTAQTFRVIPAEVHTAELRADTITREFITDVAQTGTPLVSTITSSKMDDYFTITTTNITRYTSNSRGYTVRGQVEQLTAKVNINIVFDRATPDSVFIGTFDDTATNTYIDGFVFLGGYELTGRQRQGGKLITEGSPLAGQTVSVEQGTAFCIVDASHDVSYYGRKGKLCFTPQIGFAWYDNPLLLTCNVSIAGAGEVGVDVQPVYLRDNLPDLTIVEAAKAIASITGRLLLWDEESGTIKFDEGDISTWKKIDITGRVTEKGELTRTFADYAQYNNIVFDSSDNVEDSDRIREYYRVDNDTIERDNELAKIPFSEGGDRVVVNEATGVTKHLFYDNNRFDEANKDSIAIAGDGTVTYLERAQVVKNEAINNLCALSTSLNLTFRCPLILFELIDYKTLLHYAGTDFAWTELNYNNDIVSAKLSKVKIAGDIPTTRVTIRVVDKYINADETTEEVERLTVEVERGDTYIYYSSNEFNGYDVDNEVIEGVAGVEDIEVVFNYMIKTFVVDTLHDKVRGVNYTFERTLPPTTLFNPDERGVRLKRGNIDGRYRNRIPTNPDDYDYICLFAMYYRTGAGVTEDIGGFTARVSNSDLFNMYEDSTDYHFRMGAVYDVKINVFPWTFDDMGLYSAFIVLNSDKNIFPTLQLIAG